MKIKKDDIQKLIQLYQKHYNLTGEMDLETVSSLLGLSEKESVCTLFKLFVILNDTVWRLQEENENLKELVKVTEAALEEVTQNHNEKQTALVKNGLKIKQRKFSLIELDRYLKLGYDDKKIMKEMGISKSTLWRRKKELLERQQKYGRNWVSGK